MPIARKCVFCTTQVTKANASKEDTVPKWLQAELGIANASVQPTLTAWTGERLAQRMHPVDQLLTGRVCRPCNNGWMSQLESAAIPILIPLLNSARTLSSLSRAERRVISRWAQKTAFMLDLAGLESHVSSDHVRRLYTGAPYPIPQAYVFGRLQESTIPWYYIASGTWNHAPLERSAHETVATDSYKVGMQFGDLILIVVHWPLNRWYFRIEKSELRKLWPETAVVKEYVHPVPQDISASDAACRRLVLSVSVVPRTGAEGYVAAT